MTYTLQALIAREEVLRVVSEQNVLMLIIPLKQNVGMLPITSTLRKSLDEDESRFHEEHPFHRLFSTVQKNALNASSIGRIAYIEAEFFGGIGYQSAILWEDGKAILGPFLAQNLPLPEMPINRVLREMGVIASDQIDEFDTLGLGIHRETDKWLSD